MSSRRSLRPLTVLLAILVLEGCQSPIAPSVSPPVVTSTPDPSPTPIPLDRALGWSNGTSMSVRRAFHTATRLLDGTVLIVGGDPPATITFGELYDSATDSFKQTSPLNRLRQSPGTALLTDGRVLVAGSNGLSAEVYDPATGAWSLTGSMVRTRRSPPLIVLADGRVLAVGGHVSNVASMTVEVFDPTTSTWAALADLSTGRAGHTLALLPDGRVLVAGGAHSLAGIKATDTVEIFDSAAGSFAAGPSMHHPRQDHTSTVLADGRVLVVGGSSQGEVLDSAEIFDPASGGWTEVAPANDPHQTHTATLLPDGRVLIAGGDSEGAGSAEVFDPRSGTWRRTEEMITFRAFHTATLLVDGRVLVAGGIDDSQAKLTSTELWLD